MNAAHLYISHGIHENPLGSNGIHKQGSWKLNLDTQRQNRGLVGSSRSGNP